MACVSRSVPNKASMGGLVKQSSLRAINLVVLLILTLCSSVSGETVALTDANIDSILSTHEVVLVNFYADWCRFSQILAPVFEESSEKVRQEFMQPGKVAFGKVDCDREVNIASRYRISKYPTLKMFRNGQVVKKEYRGQRSADSIANFIREQLRDAVEEVSSLDALQDLGAAGKKRHIIGYFDNKNSDAYRVFSRIAGQFRDDCIFKAAFGAVSAPERTGGFDVILYRPPNTQHQDQVYTGAQGSYDQLLLWATDKCVPLVREITFENAEELTEEGLPFLILFHHPDDKETPDMFIKEVSKQLLQEKSNVNFLTADGLKFTHPLHHLGKSAEDLPVLAIDSFRHMYIFPQNVKKDMSTPGLLKQFVEDLHSGKLHREFHHGPDPTTAYPTPPPPGSQDENTAQHIPKESQPQPVQQQRQPTSPPESTFKKLAPSRNRYTLLRDEF